MKMEQGRGRKGKVEREDESRGVSSPRWRWMCGVASPLVLASMKMERMQIGAFVASIWQHQAQKMACKHNKMAAAGSDNLPCMGSGSGAGEGGVAAAVGKYCHRFFRQKRINR